MAADTPYLSWEEAIEVLNQNFNFRNSSSQARGSRSYRTDPNGPSLDIHLDGDTLVVKLPGTTSVATGSYTLNGPFTYHNISSTEDLLNCIKSFKGTASASQSQPPFPQNERKSPSTMTAALNTILYGPPGTGKTFKTAEMAVRIADGDAGNSRERIMARYEELRKEGRINFVTFHQSYGYEDFVEGLKPESIDGQITYPIRPGVFRKICEAARRSAMVKPGLTGKALRERTIYKMSLGRAGTSEGNLAFQHCIENGHILLGWGDHVDFSGCRTADEIRSKLEQDHPDGESLDSQARYVEVFKNEMRVGDIVIVSQGNRAFRAVGEVIGDYEFLEEGAAGRFHQMRQVRWLAVFEGNRDVEKIFDRNFMQSSLYRLDHGGLRLEVLERLIKEQQDTSTQNFILIIDEINRANLSKVFGELITLLEADKRERAVNALTVKLPYSGDDFSVPSNLYIVGTMNTADRSIALLDTALRRRFEFQELQPDYKELQGVEVEGIQLGTLLESLNERIDYLYDRDHTIGHAYFINIKSRADLDAAFRRKVIPLLQEYFYEDWSKIRLVLNDRAGLFVESKVGIPKGLESAAEGYEPRPQYRIRDDRFPLDAYFNIYR